MNNFKKNLMPIILLSLLLISSLTLFLVSSPVSDASGDLVLVSDVELALQDASQTMLVICCIVGLLYMHTNAVAKQARKPKKQAIAKTRQVERHVSYMGIKA